MLFINGIKIKSIEKEMKIRVTDKLVNLLKIKKEMIQSNLLIIKKRITSNFRNKNIPFQIQNNTVLLIEPRFKKHTYILLANTYNYLGENWNYVFYCGSSSYLYWKQTLPNFIEIRSLSHDNYKDTKEYSDFCKQKELWESLYGDFVLTIQLDTWIMNKEPYTIDYFIRLNKSYLGGNMQYKWGYFDKMNIHHPFRNFNGGLSLRKRMDMIAIIESFPPEKTTDDQTIYLKEHEDVYFTNGCILLDYPIGDDEESSHFSLHTINQLSYFGIHQPCDEIKTVLNQEYPYLKYLNPDLKMKK